MKKVLSCAVSAAMAASFTPQVLADVTVNKAKTADKHFAGMDAYIKGIAIPTGGRYFGGSDINNLENFQLEYLAVGDLEASEGDPAVTYTDAYRITFDVRNIESNEVVTDSFDLSFALDGTIDDSGLSARFGGVGTVTPNGLTMGGVPLFSEVDLPSQTLGFDFDQSIWTAPLYQGIHATSPDNLLGQGPYMQFVIAPQFGGASLDGSLSGNSLWRVVPGPGSGAMFAVTLFGCARRRRRSAVKMSG